MSMYWTCPLCGANLDPGEACDCQEDKEDKGNKEAVKTAEKRTAETYITYVVV